MAKNEMVIRGDRGILEEWQRILRESYKGSWRDGKESYGNPRGNP